MDIQIQTFVYKPVFVKAVIVTDENMKEVAAWCGGQIETHPSKFDETKEVAYIKVGVLRPLTSRQSKAYSGDLVVNLNREDYPNKDLGFKVYTSKAFYSTFDVVVDNAAV